MPTQFCFRMYYRGHDGCSKDVTVTLAISQVLRLSIFRRIKEVVVPRVVRTDNFRNDGKAEPSTRSANTSPTPEALKNVLAIRRGNAWTLIGHTDRSGRRHGDSDFGSSPGMEYGVFDQIAKRVLERGGVAANPDGHRRRIETQSAMHRANRDRVLRHRSRLRRALSRPRLRYRPRRRRILRAQTQP
jgi:hypothetical protein